MQTKKNLSEKIGNKPNSNQFFYFLFLFLLLLLFFSIVYHCLSFDFYFIKSNFRRCETADVKEKRNSESDFNQFEFKWILHSNRMPVYPDGYKPSYIYIYISMEMLEICYWFGNYGINVEINE